MLGANSPIREIEDIYRRGIYTVPLQINYSLSAIDRFDIPESVHRGRLNMESIQEEGTNTTAPSSLPQFP